MSLRDEKRKLVRRTDPQTSRDAARSLDLNRLEAAVLSVLQRADAPGLTTFEIGQASGLDRDSVSPRMPRLVRLGLVEDSGFRRQPAGKSRMAIVWAATRAGRALATPKEV